VAALVFAAGVALGVAAWRPPLWWLAAVVVLALGALRMMERRPRLAWAQALCALAFVGAFTVQAHDAARPPAWDLLAVTDGREVSVTGTVVREGGVGHGPRDQRRQLLELRAEHISEPGSERAFALPPRFHMRLAVFSRAASPAAEAQSAEEDEEAPAAAAGLSYGQRVRFTTRLRPPRNFGNPGAFDYQTYLARRGVYALGSTNTERLELLPGFGGTRAGAWRARTRNAILERAHALWPEPQAAVIVAMLIGDRSLLERSARTDFQRAGAYHVLVVSGMHVGILAFVVFWLLRRMRLGEMIPTLLTILLAAAYAYLTEANPPVVRATLMLGLFLAARLLYRQRALLNSVGAAAIGVLAYDPRALLEPSFQLTFLAVVAIAGIALPLVERTSEPYRRALRHLEEVEYDAALPPRQAQFRLDLRLLRQRLARFVGGRAAGWLLLGGARAALGVFALLLVSAVMQLALALPMAMYFHRATVLALPANATVVLLAGVLLPAASTALLLLSVSATVAALPAAVAGWCVTGMTGTVGTLGALPVADLRVPAPTLGAALFAASAFVLALLLARRRPAFAAAGMVTLAAAAAWLALAPPPAQLRPGVLEITALDVGQGDAILVVTPQGRSLLIDAGGPLGPWPTEFDHGEDVVSPYLWSRGIVRLDVLALTHAHADHIGGLRSVIANFAPRELWVGVNPATRPYRELLESAAARGLTVRQRWAGEGFEFGGAQVEVLAPPPGWRPARRPRNDDSLVLRFEYGNTSALLAGDVERRMERMLAREARPADLLKVAHHGSATSTTPELLEAVRPRYAVISVGTRSPYNHPRPEVLHRLAGAQAATFRTDTLGAVTFYLDGESVTPRTRVLR
jgi:competence protein ComEC